MLVRVTIFSQPNALRLLFRTLFIRRYIRKRRNERISQLSTTTINLASEISNCKFLSRGESKRLPSNELGCLFIAISKIRVCSLTTTEKINEIDHQFSLSPCIISILSSLKRRKEKEKMKTIDRLTCIKSSNVTTKLRRRLFPGDFTGSNATSGSLDVRGNE